MNALKHVDTLVLETIQEHGYADFFLVLSEQADLSRARTMTNKLEKGTFVVNALQAIADQTQPPVLAELESYHVDVRPFYIQNMILVRNGSLDILLAMSSRRDITKILGNHRIDFDNDQPRSYIDNTPHREPEWNLSHVGIPDVWAAGVTGEGIVVANLGHRRGLDASGLEGALPGMERHNRRS